MVGGTVLTVGVVVAPVWLALGGTSNSPASTASGSPSALMCLQTYSDLSRDHASGHPYALLSPYPDLPARSWQRHAACISR